MGPALSAQENSAAAEETAPAETALRPAAHTDSIYRDKTSGDEALKAQDFEVAASFYAAYRKEAEKNGDTDAIRNAYECEIDAWILGGRPAQASAALTEYLKLFPKIRNLSTDLWNAEILLLKKDASGAEKILRRTLEALPQTDPRRLRTIAALAAVNEMQKNFRAAAALYGELAGKAGGLLGRRAAERRILALTADGRTAEAVALLKDLKLEENERSIEAFRLLNIYLSLKNGSADPVRDSWEEAKKSTACPAGNFFFLISSLIGDEFLAQEDFAQALDAYRLAFHYARLKCDSFDALARVVATLKKMEKKEEASALAARHLDLFRSPLAAPEIKLFLISLFSGTGRNPEALKLCNSLLSDWKNTGKERKQAFEKAFAILLKNKAWAECTKLVESYFPASQEPFPAARMWLGAIDEARGERRNAVKHYLLAANTDETLFLEGSLRALELLDTLRDFKGIVEVAGKVLARDRCSPARFYRAAAYESLGDTARARADYLAFAGQPDTDSEKRAQALFQAAELFFREKNYEAAEAVFERLVRNCPDSGLAPLAACRDILSKFNRNQTGAAEQRTLELAERYPASRYTGIARLKLAGTYVDSGALEKAVELLDGIIKSSAQPSIRAQALYRKALLEYQLKHYKEADTLLKTLEKDFSAEPCFAGACYLRGELHRARNEFSAAAACYRKAAALNKGSVLEQAALGSEADCLFAIASNDDSAQAFRDALAHYENLLAIPGLLPEYEVMTLYKTARCRQLLGETEKAAGDYKKLLYFLPVKELPARPRECFWILKGMSALERIALQSADAALINSAIDALHRLNAAGVPGQGNYRRRIGELRKLKRQIIHTEGMKK